MTLAHFVYVAASITFAAFITWMFVYSIRHKNPPGTIPSKGRPTMNSEGDLPIATWEKERPGKPGSNS